MPVESRVRVDIFVPVRREDPTYPAVIDWLKYWLAYVHGGVTLSSSAPTVFTGYYRNPEQPDELIQDEIVWIMVDIPVHMEDQNLQVYLSELKHKIQTDLYKEIEIWITYAGIYRVV